MTTRTSSPAAKEETLNEFAQHVSVSQKEGLYEKLLQQLPAALYTTDHKGFVTMYNAAAVELWGRAPVIHEDQWCGSWKIFKADGQELPLDECPMAITLRNGLPVTGHEIIIERPDGTRRHIMPHPQPIFDASGNLTGAVNMLVDITQLKVSEQALRELTFILEKKVGEGTIDLGYKVEELRKSEERYHKMIEEVEDYAMLSMDKSGVIQNWNRGAEKIKGYKEEEIVGKNFRVFYLPEDQQRGLPDQLIAEATERGKALHEGWRVRKDGSVFWGSIVITALHDTKNNIVGFSKVTRDLTERKLAEDKIRQYTKELEFQNRELEQFAYAAAHDMKEPLRKIRFYTNLVYDNCGEQLPEKERDYLKRSINAASRMQILIDDLLTYSKTSSEEMEYKKVDLGKVIAELQLAHYDTIRELNAEIETGNLPVIDGVSFQVMQLFDNLLGNALKYHHPERKPHIRIFSEKVTGPDPEIDLAKDGETYYRVTVADNGIGFDSQYSEKVFDLFQRLHDKVHYSGTGIGLTLCRKIIQNHQGFMVAHGEEGKGASFMVYFPATEG
jgi:PAS domain S-box-containing protein